MIMYAGCWQDVDRMGEWIYYNKDTLQILEIGHEGIFG